MVKLLSNGDSLGILISIILFVMFGIPLILLLIGIFKYARGNKNSGKKWLIAAVVYVLIGLGICGIIMGGFNTL